MMMAILMTIVALAVVLYAAAMVFKRRYKMRAEEVRNQVESIEKASLDADFAKLSRRRHCMDAAHLTVHKHAACNVLIGGDIP